ncbi:hypothetical protein RND81_03G222800 [Saponaria officinalis]|uniref:Pectinesterase inhibitor domain-containing protein n=1 Tax=Saponaria officinalis TaxID=3572 RepID=A0AAW1M235_SAPOF
MKHHNYVIMSLLFVTFITSTTLAKGANLVPETCKKISISEPSVRYDFCVTVLGSDRRSSTANLQQLAEISFNLSVSKAKSISKKIGELLKDPKFNTFQKNALKDCQELYSDAPDDIQTGLKALLNEKDFEKANIEVSGAITSADTCEDGFSERKEFSPLTGDNNYFMELAKIPLVFIVLLK